MYPEALKTLRKILAGHEGVTRHMYLDEKGLVTTAIGNLIEPKDRAYGFKWRRISDGQSALRPDIDQEWQQIKAKQEFKSKGGGFYRQFATILLDDSEVEAIFANRASSFENSLKTSPHLKPYFKDFDTFPSVAQIGILFWCWATGGGKPSEFPFFKKACQERNWEEAARQCLWSGMDPKARTILPQLFNNAANLEEAQRQGQDWDLSEVQYPKFVLKPSRITAGPDEPDE
jgi:hypothetical protein